MKEGHYDVTINDLKRVESNHMVVGSLQSSTRSKGTSSKGKAGASRLCACSESFL